jgi:hypothetical protein
MVVWAFPASAFPHYDIVANHKYMFGFAPVVVAFFGGGLFSAAFGTVAGVVTQTNRPRREGRDRTT